jgi:hypothetical protein
MKDRLEFFFIISCLCTAYKYRERLKASVKGKKLYTSIHKFKFLQQKKVMQQQQFPPLLQFSR